MAAEDKEDLYAEYWPDGPVEIFDNAEPNGMPVVSTPLYDSVRSPQQANDFLSDARFRRIEEWYYEDDGEYYVAKVEFLGWDDDPTDNEGLKTSKLIDRATLTPMGEERWIRLRRTRRVQILEVPITASIWTEALLSTSRTLVSESHSFVQSTR